MVTQIAVYSCQRILLNAKMLETADSFRNMGESQKYYVQKKPDTKVLAIWFHLYETRK